MSDLTTICQNAKASKAALARMSTPLKNEVLNACANALVEQAPKIMEANQKDMEASKAKGMNQGLLDRLYLDEKRIASIASGMKEVADLEDPIGEVLGMKKRPNGLMIGTKRVPLGVVGVIYEARPNVTADVFALCFKTGNALILKGGSDAANSNKAIVDVICDVLKEKGIDPNSVQLITDNSRENTAAFMKMDEYVDVLIPRGGAGLISAVKKQSTIPVIETGTGNCHIFVDESADQENALDIIENAKTQRIGVCNACESLLIHENIAEEFLPKLVERLKAKNVEMRVDEKLLALDPTLKKAQEEDWGKEYLDLIISVKTVSGVDEAIEHINKYSTHHSESILSQNYSNAQKFLDEVDSAAVYVNASTRFTDGNEFGFGAEIGISTQKLHARGPMGLKALTSTKFIIYGNGQIRP
jgi:glutamate-5-semialdehyde dehydrogenase